MMNMRAMRVVVAMVVTLIGAGRAAAQCEPEWRAFDPSTAAYPGVNGLVNATTMWDPDGPGPITPKLVVGGQFTLAGNTLANNIALYDPVTGAWSALGTGITGTNSTVRAIATLPNGGLVAGGFFTTAGGVSANNIARWNGSAWSALGTGMSDGFGSASVRALTTLANGDLVAGGTFETAGGVFANNIARWNGSAWSPLGTGIDHFSNPVVYALITLPNGDLVVGGFFTTAGDLPANSIARWNGSAWSALGTGMVDSSVRALTTLANGDLVAGGTFTRAGSVNASFIARWNGSAWSALGTGMASSSSTIVSALTTLPNGDLVAGGSFTIAGGVPGRNIARWNGSAWAALGSGMVGISSFQTVRALTALPNGDLVAGGDFWAAGGVDARYISRWNGSAWSALGTGVISANSSSPRVYSIATLPNGDLVAGGDFTSAGGVAASRIARWNGSAWSALGTGMNGTVWALTTLPNGDLVAGGSFTTAGGVFANNIARWNGSAWSALGTGMNSDVYALTTLSSGDLVAGGLFTTAGGVAANYIARWNGSSWSALGEGLTGAFGSPSVRALLTFPNGDLVAGGNFLLAGGVSARYIARWNGSTWSPLGAGLSGTVWALTTLPNGDLVVGGSFETAVGVAARYIARLNGSAWSALGTGMNSDVYALATLPSGDLVAGGFFTTAGGVAANSIARWNGSAWAALGTGINGGVWALTTLPNGDLVAGGDFTTAGSTVVPYIARYSSTPACYANCDCSPGSTLSPSDFTCFVNNFREGRLYADCDNSGGLVSPADFTCFLARYRAGCP